MCIQLGGDNFHLDQCNSLPEEFNEQLFYQRECPAKFNSVQVSVKRKFSVQPTPHAKHCRRSNATEKGDILFPGYCMIYVIKKRITVRKQIQHPTKIVTYVAEKKIKSAAELKQYFRLLGLISGVDLIAKGFQKHHKCYADYTRDVCNTKTTTVDSNTESLYEKGDYVKVCKMVDEQIIGEKKCVFSCLMASQHGQDNTD